MSERTGQIKQQCKVVAELSWNLAEIYDAHTVFLHPDIEEQIGRKSAYLMQVLGDILNGMDRVSEEDEWMDPVFDRAAKMFPEAARRKA